MHVSIMQLKINQTKSFIILAVLRRSV